MHMQDRLCLAQVCMCCEWAEGKKPQPDISETQHAQPFPLTSATREELGTPQYTLASTVEMSRFWQLSTNVY